MVFSETTIDRTDRLVAQINDARLSIETGIGETAAPGWAAAARLDVAQTLSSAHALVVHLTAVESSEEARALAELGRSLIRDLLGRLQVRRAKREILCPFREGLDSELSELAYAFAAYNMRW